MSLDCEDSPRDLVHPALASMLWPHMKQNAIDVEHLEPRRLLAGYPISVGSSAYDTAFKITKIANDGVLVAGLFKGTIDLDRRRPWRD